MPRSARGLRNRRSEVRILSGALSDSAWVGDSGPLSNARRWQHRGQRGNSEQVAPRADRCAGHLSAWFEVRLVYRTRGRQRKQYAGTLAEARAIKVERDGEARAERRGPTLHAYTLGWLERYSGSGHDSLRENTRREYRRLLVNFALTYFDREVRVRDLDRAALQSFVDWLTSRPGRRGRLGDRSIANALTPLRVALDAAVAEGLLDANPAAEVVLPRRRAGRAWSTRERRFLTRAELVRLLDEVPAKWRPLFELLAATGLRISEAVDLRWSDLVLDEPAPHLQVRRAIVKGVTVAPKSRHGARLIPLTPELAATLRAHRPRKALDDAFVFPGRDGGASDQGSLRRRVLVPAAERAGLTGVGFHTLRHTCASMLIESGLSPAAPAALDGPPLARIHARDLRAPDRRRPWTCARSAPGTAAGRAVIAAARRASRTSSVLTAA
jgi:integrase